MKLDLDRFKTIRPWRDITFWVALATTVVMLLPLVEDSWRSRRFPTGGQLGAAIWPLSAWLIANGIVRYGSVRAAGVAAAAIGPEIVRHETVFGSVEEPQRREGLHVIEVDEGDLPQAPEPEPDMTADWCCIDPNDRGQVNLGTVIAVLLVVLIVIMIARLV